LPFIFLDFAPVENPPKNFGIKRGVGVNIVPVNKSVCGVIVVVVFGIWIVVCPNAVAKLVDDLVANPPVVDIKDVKVVAVKGFAFVTVKVVGILTLGVNVVLIRDFPKLAAIPGVKPAAVTDGNMGKTFAAGVKVVEILRKNDCSCTLSNS
jgi:hypothetical protein